MPSELISLANRQLSSAKDELINEMRKFYNAMSHTGDYPEWSDDDQRWEEVKKWQDYRAEPGWSDDDWAKLKGDHYWAQQEILKREDVSPRLQGLALEDRRLLATVDWLTKQLIDRFQRAGTSPKLETVVKRAQLLGEINEMWAVSRTAWEQRHREGFGIPLEDQEVSRLRDILRDIQAGDNVVRRLYQVVKDKELDLIIDHQLLITVPFANRLYASGFDAPTPYIVSPYWGYRQVWTWLGYAHEVGHNVYRNVKGLSDELKVNVTIGLSSQKTDYTIQRIWFNWLEEIFADLFGLLRVGPAFAHAQQHMLLYLPLQEVRRVEKDYDEMPLLQRIGVSIGLLPRHLQVLQKVGEDYDPREGLLRAADETHPTPYLRALLTIRALQKLGIPYAVEGDKLLNRWNNLFQENPRVDTSKVYARVRGRDEKLDVEEMDRTRDIVLEILLDTRLYTLARKSSSPQPPTPRRLIDVLLTPLNTEYEEKVKEAGKAIDGKPHGEFDERHLLAAAQDELEKLADTPITIQTIGTLSERVLGAIEKIPPLEWVE